MGNDQLISKIASAIGDNNHISLDDKKNIALKVASQMLSVAAEKQEEMLEKIAKMQAQIDGFVEEKRANEKHDLVKEVVGIMFESGVLTKQAMIEKEEELLKLDIPGINIIKDTLLSIPPKAASEGFNELTFLCGDNNIREKASFATVVAEYGKN